MTRRNTVKEMCPGLCVCRGSRGQHQVSSSSDICGVGWVDGWMVFKAVSLTELELTELARLSGLQAHPLSPSALGWDSSLFSLATDAASQACAAGTLPGHSASKRKLLTLGFPSVSCLNQWNAFSFFLFFLPFFLVLFCTVLFLRQSLVTQANF